MPSVTYALDKQTLLDYFKSDNVFIDYLHNLQVIAVLKKQLPKQLVRDFTPHLSLDIWNKSGYFPDF